MHYHVEYRNNTDQNFEPLSTASVNSREILPWEGDVVSLGKCIIMRIWLYSLANSQYQIVDIVFAGNKKAIQ